MKCLKLKRLICCSLRAESVQRCGESSRASRREVVRVHEVCAWNNSTGTCPTHLRAVSTRTTSHQLRMITAQNSSHPN
ncbi:hypothetical protein GRJ2_001864100 [Grus japonensis]|uniref:Secreted protein n=1 Tax=Grus japonensis TaxID=30415 RepID=A0ABC9X8I9_GRUJA